MLYKVTDEQFLLKREMISSSLNNAKNLKELISHLPSLEILLKQVQLKPERWFWYREVSEEFWYLITKYGED
jgi:hypothetical protein